MCVVLIIACFLLFTSWFFLFVRAHWVCLFWFLRFVVMVMIISGLIVFFSVKVPLFFVLTPLCVFPGFLLICMTADC